jgi:hypothetical protein
MYVVCARQSMASNRHLKDGDRHSIAAPVLMFGHYPANPITLTTLPAQHVL